MILFPYCQDSSVITNTTRKGMPWIWPCLGSGLYGFSMAGLLPISLTFLIDSYSQVSRKKTQFLESTFMLTDLRQDHWKCLGRREFCPVYAGHHSNFYIGPMD